MIYRRSKWSCCFPQVINSIWCRSTAIVKRLQIARHFFFFFVSFFLPLLFCLFLFFCFSFHRACLFAAFLSGGLISALCAIVDDNTRVCCIAENILLHGCRMYFAFMGKDIKFVPFNPLRWNGAPRREIFWPKIAISSQF